MFKRWATIYDFIYAAQEKDYRTEAKRVSHWIEEYSIANSPQERPRLLDVASGTGEHLRYFQERFDVSGIDQSSEMLAVARTKLPKAFLTQADMTDFDLEDRFQAITCLFSSIGYLEDVAALQSSIGCMSRHLLPGGVLVLEPAVDPARLRPPKTTVLELEIPGGKARRTTSALHRGSILEIIFNFRIESDGSVDEFADVHSIRLFTPKDYWQSLERAGLAVVFEERGLSDLGVYIGVKFSEPRRG